MIFLENNRLSLQLAFLTEIDRMKNILRQTLLCDRSRRENDAEHSWHLAMCASVLFEYAPDSVSLPRVLTMALVHDLIEIYAGDTFAYDEAGYTSKEAREREAADRLYAMLPSDQGVYYRALWEEFDAMETPDARFANACDRLQPFLNNIATDGHTWRLGKVRLSQVRRRMAIVCTISPALGEFVEENLRNAVERGQLIPD